MIVRTNDDKQIMDVLHKELMSIRKEAKKRFKKQLLKIIASGMTSKNYVHDYQITTPSNNNWAVTTVINPNDKKDPIRTSACCVVDSDDGREYLILRGTRFGGLFYFRIYSHVVKRIRERTKKYKDISAGAICNRIFKPNELAYSFFTDKEDVDAFWTEDLKEDVNSMIIALSGIYFGRLFHDESKKMCHVNIKTFITPEMIATHEQHEMYRCAMAQRIVDKNCIIESDGKNEYAFLKRDSEVNKALKVIEEYKTDPCSIAGMMVVPE